MKINIYKTILIIGLAAALMFTPAGQGLAADKGSNSELPAASDGNAVIKGRDEVIYAVLASDGSVNDLYAVNHFSLEKAGCITDYGKYTKVTNLTDTGRLTYTDGAVTFNANTENFHYQGDMAEKVLPWIFDIKYYLNGAETGPQELAGSSGKLEIKITSKRNEAVDPLFYENYMLQISITLDTDKSSDIHAPDAVLANAGKNKVAAYTVLPGRDADISLSAMVRDFSMAGMEITAMPFSMNVEPPDTDEMLDDFTQLSDAISRLNDGVEDLTDGIARLKTGAGSLKKGSAGIKSGLSRLDANSGQLLQASSQIGGALTQIVSSLNNASGDISEGMDLSELALLPGVLSQLADGLKQTAGGLTEFKGGFTAAHGALAGAIQEIPDTQISEEQVMLLYANTDASQYALLNQLLASYTAGLTVKGTYNFVKDAFDAVEPAIDEVSASITAISAALDEISEKANDALSDMDMTRQLAQLTAGLSQLEKNYGTFHKGLKDYMAGVSGLSGGYEEFHSGLASFGDGISDLYDGVSELHDGTEKLKDETIDMPDIIQSEIDDMLDQYTGSDFEPVSFTSPENKKVDLVQFVIRTEGIEKPEETGEEAAETIRETIWDRLLALFRGGRKG